MEKVLSGWERWRVISAQTTLESSPPLRKAPKGTSETNRTRTASSSSAKSRSCSVSSSSVHLGRKSTWL